MAITAAALQTAIDADLDAETGISQQSGRKNVKVIRGSSEAGTVQTWYVLGGTGRKARALMIDTTASDDAGTQAAAILSALA